MQTFLYDREDAPYHLELYLKESPIQAVGKDDDPGYYYEKVDGKLKITIEAWIKPKSLKGKIQNDYNQIDLIFSKDTEHRDKTKRNVSGKCFRLGLIYFARDHLSILDRITK